VVNKFFNNMSAGAASLLKESMEYQQDLAQAQVDEARTQIVEHIKVLEKEGKIALQKDEEGGGFDEVIAEDQGPSTQPAAARPAVQAPAAGGGPAEGKRFYDGKRGWVKALEDLSFEVNHGEVLGLLGPNGAGKTTVLRIIATLLSPDQGVCRIDGRDVRENPVLVRQRIGYLSHSTGLYERLTPEEFLDYTGRLHELSEKHLTTRMDELKSLLGLEKYWRIPCSSLSAGNRQKVSLARALIHDPPILILDEPTNALDILAAKRIFLTIKDLKNTGKTILYSSHYLHEAEELCDRVVFLNEGKKVLDGQMAEVKSEYQCQTLEEVFFKIMLPEATKI